MTCESSNANPSPAATTVHGAITLLMYWAWQSGSLLAFLSEAMNFTMGETTEFRKFEAPLATFGSSDCNKLVSIWATRKGCGLL